MTIWQDACRKRKPPYCESQPERAKIKFTGFSL